MNFRSFRFLLVLLSVLLLVFIIHLLTLDAFEYPLWSHKIVLAYLINFVLASIVVLVVQHSLKSQSAQAGFIFLAGSALKFLVFFLVFYPTYKKDGAMETIEFITFFVPYGVCLILEVLYLSKQLNNQ